MLWPILAAVILQWEAPALQRQCIEVILCIELKQSCCENLESVLSVFAKLSDLEIIFCHFKVCSCRLVTFVSWLESDNISPVFRYIFEICPLLMVCTWKKACSKHLQRCGTKYWCFMWAQWSTAWGVFMQLDGLFCAPQWVHIVLLLASFDVALPSER